MLLATESSDEYSKFREALIKELQPAGPVEQMYVDDIIAYTWEIARYRRAKANIISGDLYKALERVLRHHIGPTYALVGWFDKPNRMERAKQMLAKYDLDSSVIAGEALRKNLDDLEQCERLEVVALSLRDKAYHMLAALRSDLGLALRRSSDRVLKNGSPKLIPSVDAGTE